MAARVSDAKGCAGNFYVIGHTPTRSRVRRAAALRRKAPVHRRVLQRRALVLLRVGEEGEQLLGLVQREGVAHRFESVVRLEDRKEAVVLLRELLQLRLGGLARLLDARGVRGVRRLTRTLRLLARVGGELKRAR